MGLKSDNLRSRGIYLLPNLFTISALFAGFYAVVTALKGIYDNAAISIYIAMIMDLLDGRIARLTNTQTAFGAELDSLSDMVAFGVAPALVAYSWVLNTLGKLGWLAAFSYTAAAALRLARFNTQLTKTNHIYFQGLPSPAAAGTIAGLIWMSCDLQWKGWLLTIFTLLLILTTAILMVSNIRYRSFKNLDLRHHVPFLSILILVLLLVLIAVDPPEILFLAFLVFTISGPVLTLRKLHEKREQKRNKKIERQEQRKNKKDT